MDISLPYCEKNGLVRRSDLISHGLSQRAIDRLLAEGDLNRVRQGWYQIAGSLPEANKFELAAQLFPDGIFCLRTALYLYGYVTSDDCDPNCLEMAFERNVTKSRFKNSLISVKPSFVEARHLNYGVGTVGVGISQALIFTRDRLICECLRAEKKLDPCLLSLVIKKYRQDPFFNELSLINCAIQRNMLIKVARVFQIDLAE